MIEESKSPVGKEILSLNFGVGVIAGVEKLQEDGDEFYVVEHGNNKTKNYFPVEENKKIRFLSTKKEFDKNIKRLKSETITKDFESRKDRVVYFNVVLGDCGLTQVVDRILEINSMDDLIGNEQEKLDKLIEFLEVEASLVYDIEQSESKKLISDCLS